MKYVPKRPEGNVNVTPGSPIRSFFVLLGGSLAILVGIYILLGLAVDLLVHRIPPSVEARIGDLVLGTLGKPRMATPEEEVLQRMVDEIQERCADLPYRLSVRLYKSDVTNAVALPGGTIAVFSGLVAKMDSENELAFVLAHESGHFVHRDHLKGLGRSLVLMILSAALFGGDSRVGEMLVGWVNVAEMGFSRRQETQADAFALATLHCRYGHVGGAVDFFEKLAELGDTGPVGHFFSTHPRNRKRIAHLEAFRKANGYPLGPLRPLPEALSPEEPKPAETKDSDGFH